MEMEDLRLIGFWGDVQGNEGYLSPLVPVFEDGAGKVLTTSLATGDWTTEDLFEADGDEQFFTAVDGLDSLVPEYFLDQWNFWIMGSELRLELERLKINWRGVLPEGRAVKNYSGFALFAATTRESIELRERLCDAVGPIWRAVLRGESEASSRTDMAMDIERKLNRKSTLWDRFAYYYLTGNRNKLKTEATLQAFRREPGNWTSGEWIAAQIKSHLERLRTKAS